MSIGELPHDFQSWVCLKMLCTPLYPMVLLIIIPMKNGYFIGNINPTFSDTPICHPDPGDRAPFLLASPMLKIFRTAWITSIRMALENPPEIHGELSHGKAMALGP